MMNEFVSSFFYHTGDRLRHITNLWHICKQVYHESYKLSISRIVFSFGNHLVAQDYIYKYRNSTHQHKSISTLHFNTLREFKNLPLDDLRELIGLKRLAIQCGEKTCREWILWDGLPKEQRDIMRTAEKQAVREKVQGRLEKAFPGNNIEIQVGLPPFPGRVDDERLLEVYWDGGKTR